VPAAAALRPPGHGQCGQAGRLCPLRRTLFAPEVYDADHPTLGTSQWEFDARAAIYDNASTVTELLAKKGALKYRHCPGVSRKCEIGGAETAGRIIGGGMGRWH